MKPILTCLKQICIISKLVCLSLCRLWTKHFGWEMLWDTFTGRLSKMFGTKVSIRAFYYYYYYYYYFDGLKIITFVEWKARKKKVWFRCVIVKGKVAGNQSPFEYWKMFVCVWKDMTFHVGGKSFRWLQRRIWILHFLTSLNTSIHGDGRSASIYSKLL